MNNIVPPSDLMQVFSPCRRPTPERTPFLPLIATFILKKVKSTYKASKATTSGLPDLLTYLTATLITEKSWIIDQLFDVLID